MWFLDHAWLVPLIPAVSFVLILFFGKRMPKQGSEVGVFAVGASFVLSLGALVQWINHVNDVEDKHGAGAALGALGRSVGRLTAEHERVAVGPITHSTTWFESGGIKLTAGIQIDGLAVMMMFVVTLISFLVHVYSTEYMRGDRRYTHFFAILSLFTASMLLLVVADNTLQMLVGWELVGLCSFMLIGHWWEEKANSDAAVKAFLTTRTGDIGLIVGVVMTYFMVDRANGGPSYNGSFNIVKVNEAALSGKPGHTLILWCAVGLLCGIIGKSGQFPLHTWLPDAMAGPTPVSALIHAATMVVAGVYLGARLFPVFYTGFSIHGSALNPMAIVGAITILVGASLAFVQDDIKKVLAYSTISQLGYMVMGLGVGAWAAAVFHLFTHAFFKADLFLGAGSVSHSGSHHSFDMKRDMGGLRKYMPQTHATFLIATLSLMGAPLLAGFWSKDEIITNAGHNGYTTFMVVGLIGAVMTAAYMTRCVYLTFWGEYRGAHPPEPEPHIAEHDPAEDLHDLHGALAHGEDHAHEPHESNWLITGPLWVLTFFALFAGYVNVPHHENFTSWFEPRVAFPSIEHAEFSPLIALISVALAFTGVAVAYAYYDGRLPQRLSERYAALRVGKRILVNKYYLDFLYENIIVAGIKGPIASGVYWFNQHVIDNVLNYAGRGAQVAGRFTYNVVDQQGVDRFVNGIGTATDDAGGATRVVQNGRLQWYALVLVAAVGVFALALWIFT